MIWNVSWNVFWWGGTRYYRVSWNGRDGACSICTTDQNEFTSFIGEKFRESRR